MDKMDSKYHVGDRVVVKSVGDCIYGSNGQMESLVGSIVTIRRVSWEMDEDIYSYRIQEDDGWTWDDSCFEAPVQELPMPDISGTDVLSLFS